MARRSRSPDAAEIEHARQVFGDTLDLTGVRIVASRVWTVGGYARCLPGVVYWPPAWPRDDALMVHEFTHLWQYQHGVSLATTAWYAVRGRYDYGGEAGLRAAAAAGKRFRDFGTEQQGDICRHYWQRLQAGADTSAYDPFLADVRAS